MPTRFATFLNFLLFIYSTAYALVCVDFRDPLNRTAGLAIDCTPLGRTHDRASTDAVLISLLHQRQLATNFNATSSVRSSSTPSSSGRPTTAPPQSQAASTTVIDVMSQVSSQLAQGTPDTTASDLRSPIAGILAEAPLPAPTAGTNQTNMFVFDMTCPSSMAIAQCQQANATLLLAGQQISNVLVLTKPVIVNVTMQSFCSTASICSTGNDILSLAAAAPARTVALIDDDNVSRLYPQAVVKQFSANLSYVPVFGQYDINLNVNSEASFFYANTGTIKSTQTDFQYVILHELMHGLGFTSAYEDYFDPVKPTTVTPNVLLTIRGTSGTIDFSGFVEYAFDRFIRLANGVMATGVVKQLNSIMADASRDTAFSSPDALGTFFLQQPQLVSLSKSLTANFTTANSASLVSAKDGNATAVVLETALSPFSAGSSVSHVSNSLYAGTGDFLMRYSTQRGASFQQYITAAKSAGAQDIDLYNGIGPGLRIALANLGYRVRGGVPAVASVQTAGSKSTTATAGAAAASAGIVSQATSIVGGGGGLQRLIMTIASCSLAVMISMR